MAFKLHLVSVLSIEISLRWTVFSNSVVIKDIEQNHNSNKNIILECLCHGFTLAFSDDDECVEWLACVMFVSDSLCGALKKPMNGNYLIIGPIGSFLLTHFRSSR